MGTDELTPIPYLTTEITSRYARSNVYQDEFGNKFYENYLFESIPHSEDDVYHTVRAGESGRLDLISYFYYNTVNLWWVIAIANDIIDPIFDIITGMSLRIPPAEKVFSDLMAYPRKRV